MKKISLFLCLILIVSLFSVPAMADNGSADFVLTEDRHNIRGSEIVAIPNAIGNNHAEHQFGNAYAFELPDDPANNGQMIHKLFVGDTVTFTVDFGSVGYEKFGYYWYGSNTKTVFDFYIDDTVIGQGQADGTTWWDDYAPEKWVYGEIDFGKVYTGIHQIKLVITESPAFPSCAIGKFMFYKTDVKTPDFVLTEDKHNIRGSEIVAIPNAIGNNHEEHNYGNVYAFALPDDPANDGQMLHKLFKGDTITFTVDMGDVGYESFGYYWYGSNTKTVFDFYIDDTVIGQGQADGTTWWDDYAPEKWVYGEINFDKVYTGIHQIKLVITESPAFPSCAIGKFMFNKVEVVKEPDFVLTEDKHNIRGSEIVAIPNAIANNHEEHNYGNVYAFALPDDPANDGQMLHRLFKGDVITFTVDMGDVGYESFGYYWYGLASKSVFEFYIDGTLIGTGEATGGNGWADTDSNVWTYGQIDFDKAYTGEHEIKIVITDSPAAFPANAIGKFMFNKVEKTVTPENPGIPEIGDNSLFVLLAAVVVSIGTLYFVAISRRKANV
ncbi:MAG: hypothetical protein E7385_07410 [Ruminococcaceae bacterium]|nr:hypothetical protein [Oscillospiraceae bacterium]